MKHKKYLLIIPILILAIVPFIVMLLWNSVLSSIFAIKTISYWQALGIFVLCRILFGNFGFRKNGRKPFANKTFREKWLNMNAEEKELFREQWKKRKNNC